MLAKRKSYGPKISLTSRQEDAVIARCKLVGLDCCVENCWTGSCYVTIYDVDGDEIAKIRLSGHDEGRRNDSTHCCIGGKSLCLSSLSRWLDEILESQ
jgi:hypothetical protein